MKLPSEPTKADFGTSHTSSAKVDAVRVGRKPLGTCACHAARQERHGAISQTVVCDVGVVGEDRSLLSPANYRNRSTPPCERLATCLLLQALFVLARPASARAACQSRACKARSPLRCRVPAHISSLLFLGGLGKAARKRMDRLLFLACLAFQLVVGFVASRIL